MPFNVCKLAPRVPSARRATPLIELGTAGRCFTSPTTSRVQTSAALLESLQPGRLSVPQSRSFPNILSTGISRRFLSPELGQAKAAIAEMCVWVGGWGGWALSVNNRTEKGGFCARGSTPRWIPSNSPGPGIREDKSRIPFPFSFQPQGGANSSSPIVSVLEPR